jgi:hypothetical protein
MKTYDSHDAYSDYHKAIDEEHEAQQKNKEQVLMMISSKVTPEYFEAIKEWVSDEDNGIWGNLEVIDKPIGNWQDEESEDEESYWHILNGMYVNQSCGYSGDDYNGTLTIKISETEYLKANFSL